MLITQANQPSNQLKVRRKSLQPINPHFTPVQKLGFPDGVRCWCGAELTFRYSEKGRKSKTEAFRAEHEECLPKVDEEQS